MARLFDGTNDAGSVAIDLSSTGTITIAFWLYWDAFANNDDMAVEYTTDGLANNGFYVDPNHSSGNFEVLTGVNGAGNACAARFTRPTSAEWHHYVINIDRSKSTNDIDTVYVDGVSQSLSYSTNNNPTGNFANSTLYVMSRAGTTLFGAGRMADLAIWTGINLSANEALALARGKNPRQFRAGDNPYYWPLWGNDSPELGFRSSGAGLNITLAGGVGSANHPPVAPFAWPGPSHGEIAIGSHVTGHWGWPPRRTPLSRGLVGAWDFRKGGVLKPRDYSGLGANATMVGVDQSDYVRDRYGYALDLDGTGDYLTCGNESRWDFTSGFTIEAIWKHDATADDGALVSKGFTNGVMLWLEGHTCWGYVNGAKHPAGGFSVSGAAAGLWHMAHLTWDGSTIRLFGDGVLVSSESFSTAPSSSGNDLEFGRYSSGFEALMRLGGVALWKRALPAQEIGQRWARKFDLFDGYRQRSGFMGLPIMDGMAGPNAAVIAAAEAGWSPLYLIRRRAGYR